MNSPLVTQRFTAYENRRSDEDEALFVKAAAEVIDLQLRAGITVPTDGEVRRENYIHYHCRHLDGFDFTNLEHRVLRDGAYETDLPAIRGKVSHEGRGYAAHDYRASQDVSAAPVKCTLPGPRTIMDTTADCVYDNRPQLNRELRQRSTGKSAILSMLAVPIFRSMSRSLPVRSKMRLILALKGSTVVSMVCPTMSPKLCICVAAIPITSMMRNIKG